MRLKEIRCKKLGISSIYASQITSKFTAAKKWPKNTTLQPYNVFFRLTCGKVKVELKGSREARSLDWSLYS